MQEAAAATAEAGEGEGEGESSSADAPAQTPMILPDNTVLATLRSVLRQKIEFFLREQQKLNRDIATDAALMNFELPKCIHIEIAVG